MTTKQWWADKLRHLHWKTAFGYTAFIFVLCTLPGSAFPDIPPNPWLQLDKLIHLGLWFALALCYAFALPRLGVSWLVALTLTALLGAGYGLLIEWFQESFTDRTYDIYDVYADFAGTGLGIIVAIILKSIVYSKR